VVGTAARNIAQQFFKNGASYGAALAVIWALGKGSQFISSRVRLRRSMARFAGCVSIFGILIDARADWAQPAVLAAAVARAVHKWPVGSNHV